MNEDDGFLTPMFAAIADDDFSSCDVIGLPIQRKRWYLRRQSSAYCDIQTQRLNPSFNRSIPEHLLFDWHS
jgi:hypothetical protein